MRNLLFIVIAVIALAGCSQGAEPARTDSESGMGMGMGMSSGMMERHHTKVPAPYSEMNNSVLPENISLERGGVLYTTHCASCHGDGGMGDGPASTGLDPAPSPIAHTSQMMSDDYLFWRLSEGGVTFNSAMPAWKEILDETSRWDLVNYMRALGSGDVKPRQGIGGSSYDPEVVEAQQTEMLKTAIEQGIISDTEAEIFQVVHTILDNFLATNPDLSVSSMPERQVAALAELVKTGKITQQQANEFQSIHDRLTESGLMQ